MSTPAAGGASPLVLAVMAIAVAAAVALLLFRARPAATPKVARPAPDGRTDVAARIDAFWGWWQGAAPRITAAHDEKDPRRIVEELSAAVHAIDPGLAWETGRGLSGGRYHLAVSSEGDATLRVLTERWVARAPRGGDWEFYPARQGSGVEERVLVLEDAPGVKIDSAALRVAIERDESRGRLHLTVHHPALARLPEPKRLQAIFLLLDDVLGEDGVERWIGRIEQAAEPLADGQPLPALKAAAEALAREATGDEFSLLQGRAENGRPVVVVANLGLKRLDHLLMDQHVEITFTLREPTEQGLTTRQEGDALNAAEDDLLEALGKDAVLIGHETRQGVRIIHLHVAAQGPAMGRIEAWERRHADRRPEVVARTDPQWEVLRRW